MCAMSPHTLAPQTPDRPKDFASNMPAVSSAVGNLLQSMTAIGASLLNSVFAVIQAIVALFQDLVGSVLQLVQALVAFAADLFQGVVGFVAGALVISIRHPLVAQNGTAANFFGILLVGGIYYWYTHREHQGRSGSRKRLA